MKVYPEAEIDRLYQETLSTDLPSSLYWRDRFGDLANSFEIGDYFLTNAALFSQRDNWRLGLNFNNLFDENC